MDAGVPDQCLKRRAAHLIVVRVVRERPEVQLVVHRVHSGDRVGVLDRRVALLEALDGAAEGDDSGADEYRDGLVGSTRGSRASADLTFSSSSMSWGMR